MTYHPEVLKRGGARVLRQLRTVGRRASGGVAGGGPPSWASTSSGRLLRPPTGTLQTRSFDWLALQSRGTQ